MLMFMLMLASLVRTGLRKVRISASSCDDTAITSLYVSYSGSTSPVIDRYVGEYSKAGLSAISSVEIEQRYPRTRSF